MNKFYLVVAGCALIGSIGQIAFKKGSDMIDLSKISSILGNKWLILGLFLYGMATIGYILSLRRMDLSQAYPIIALSYLFTMLLSLKFLGEKVAGINILGSMLLLLAVYLMVV